MRRFIRFFFWGVLFASIASWAYFGYVSTSEREAILVEDWYSGIEEDIIYPSQATFIAKRIFPGRIMLHSVRLFPRLLQIHFKKGLEQSEMLGLDDSFYIQVALRLNYELKPEKLLVLFRRLEKPDWGKLEDYLKFRLSIFLDRRIAALYKGDTDIGGLRERIQGYFTAKAAIEDMNQEFLQEGIHFHSLFTTRIFVPDLARYRSILAASQQIIGQKLERIRILDRARARKDAAQITNQEYFARLEKIGQLLKTYPHLRDYLAVDRLSRNVEVMVMPYQRWFSPALPPVAKDKESKNVRQKQAASPSRKEPEPRIAPPAAAFPEDSGAAPFTDLSPP